MRRWLILAIVAAGQFMFVVDAFIVNVAIPSIRAELGATAGQGAALIAVYQVAYAALVITGGRLGDLFGRRRLFILGVLAFTAASCACGLAASPGQLVLGRLGQGGAAALMVPQVLATIHILFPDAARARAFAVFGGVLGLGGAAGFVLGGVLLGVDLWGLGWRSVFLVNLPFGTLLAALAFLFIPAAEPARDTRLDIPGAVLLFGALILLVGSLLAGPDLGWPAWLALAAGAGLLLLAAFFWLEKRIDRQGGQPLVPPSLLKTRGFPRGLTTVACFQSGNLAFYLVMTLFLQMRLRFSPLDSGLAFAPMALVFSLAAQLAGRWMPRFGLRVLRAGCLLQILGVLLLGEVMASGWTIGVGTLAALLTIFGFGQGLVMAPLSGIVLANVPHAQAGAGAGVLNTVHQASGAAGIAIVGAVYLLDGLSGALAVLGLAYAATWALLRQPVPSQTIKADRVAKEMIVETSTTPEVTAT